MNFFSLNCSLLVNHLKSLKIGSLIDMRLSEHGLFLRCCDLESYTGLSECRISAEEFLTFHFQTKQDLTMELDDLLAMLGKFAKSQVEIEIKTDCIVLKSGSLRYVLPFMVNDVISDRISHQLVSDQAEPLASFTMDAITFHKLLDVNQVVDTKMNLILGESTVTVETSRAQRISSFEIPDQDLKTYSIIQPLSTTIFFPKVFKTTFSKIGYIMLKFYKQYLVIRQSDSPSKKTIIPIDT